MSTQTSTQSNENIIDRYREKWFFLALIVGMLTFAIGMAFSILVISMDTTPPAPYFATSTDQALTGVASIVFMAGGILILIRGAKLGGW